MPEWGQYAFDALVAICGCTSAIILKRLFQQLDDQSTKHEHLTAKVSELDVKMATDFISRPTLQEMVVTPMRNLERKIDTLLMRHGVRED